MVFRVWSLIANNKSPFGSESNNFNSEIVLSQFDCCQKKHNIYGLGLFQN
jgi:hypothetical protein